MNRLFSLLVLVLLIIIPITNVSVSAVLSDYMYTMKSTSITAAIHGSIRTDSITNSSLLMAIPISDSNNNRQYELVRCINNQNIDNNNQCSIIHRTVLDSNYSSISINTLLQTMLPTPSVQIYTPVLIADIVDSNNCIQSIVIFCQSEDCTNKVSYPVSMPRCCTNSDGTTIPCTIGLGYINPFPVIGSISTVSIESGFIHCPYIIWAELELTGYTIKYEPQTPNLNCPQSDNTSPFITDELQAPVHYITGTSNNNLVLQASIGPYILVSSSPKDPTDQWGLFLLICTDGPKCIKPHITFFSGIDWPINNPANLNLLFNSKGFPQIIYTSTSTESNTETLINLIYCLDPLCLAFNRHIVFIFNYPELITSKGAGLSISAGLGVNNPIIHYNINSNLFTNSTTKPTFYQLSGVIECIDDACTVLANPINYYQWKEFDSIPIKSIKQAIIVERRDGLQYIVNQIETTDNSNNNKIGMLLYNGIDDIAPPTEILNSIEN